MADGFFSSSWRIREPSGRANARAREVARGGIGHAEMGATCSICLISGLTSRPRTPTCASEEVSIGRRKKMKIFISSTVHDLKDLRASLQQWLEGRGYTVLASEDGTIPVDSSKHSYAVCLEAARDCDCLVAIIDGRF